jgi:hypothetical protein
MATPSQNFQLRNDPTSITPQAQLDDERTYIDAPRPQRHHVSYLRV